MPKPGFVTPSRIKDMMTKSRGGKGFGKTSLSYAQELALERIGVEIPDTAYGAAIDWGNDKEFQAIITYEKMMMVEVYGSQNFIKHPDHNHVGGTPDGLVGDEGGMDAKCPYNITNHLLNILENEQLDQYKYQFQGYMWITGRKWWDFVSFDPRYPEEFQLHVFRVERDQEMIDAIEERYLEFEGIIEGYIDALMEKKAGVLV